MYIIGFLLLAARNTEEFRTRAIAFEVLKYR